MSGGRKIEVDVEVPKGSIPSTSSSRDRLQAHFGKPRRTVLTDMLDLALMTNGIKIMPGKYKVTIERVGPAEEA